MRTTIGFTGVILLAAVAAGGCAAVAAGGAAAGTGIYLTTRGAEGALSVGIREAADATGDVLEDLGIRRTWERWVKEDQELEIYARLDDGDDVTIDLERVSEGLTEVEVRVRESVATWDKETARTILQELRERTGD